MRIRRFLPLLLALAPACVDGADDAPPPETEVAALDVPVGVAVRVIEQETVLHRQTHNTQFQNFPPNPGSNEQRVWVPDGPPRAYIDNAGQTRLIVPHYLSYAFVGSSLYNTALNPWDVISDSRQSADWTQHNDATWPWSPWRLPDGTLAVINHHEYHCRAHGTCAQDRWYPSLTFSRAFDGKHIGTPSNAVAARSSYGFAGDNTQIWGAYSDPTNVTLSPQTGYYYMLSMYKTGGDGSQVRGCILRNANILDPNGWRAWNGSNWNNQPVLGHDCADVTWHGNGTWAPGSLTYSTYLGKYVYVSFGRWNNRDGFWIRTALDSSLTTWSAPSLVYEARLPWQPNTPAGQPNVAYPSFLDPDAPSMGTQNFDRIGQYPYLYWVRLFGQEQRREVVRVRVRFDAGQPEVRNRQQGLYRIGGGGYYSNGQNQYCAIWGIPQLQGCGWGYDFWNLPEYADHGPNTLQGAYSGRCTCGVPPVPHGCYRIGGTGFFSNGAGRSCPFLGSQMQSICGHTNFWALPERGDHGLNAVDGQCTG